VSPPDEAEDSGEQARHKLAARLRELRVLARLSGQQLGERCGWRQSKTSRLETGTTVPQIADVEAWLDAVDAPPEVRNEVLDLTEAALTSASSWEHEHARGLSPNQRRIARLEAAASVYRSFQVDIVPGILQTPAYARAVMELANPFGKSDLAEGVKARLDRQAILFDPAKRFQIIMWEPALRWRPVPLDIMRGQIDRIASLLDLPNIEIGVIPLDKPMSTILYHGFLALGEPGVDADVVILVETVVDELRVRDAHKVRMYLDLFARLRDEAVYGDEARELLRAAV
jgi:transcriptional regulator with XRE-family HTH domain